MDILDSEFCSERNFRGVQLNEQLSVQMFEVLHEQNPIMIIMDREGYFWVSNPEKFSDMNVSEAFLKELCGRIDDGDEPVVSQVEDCSVIGTQLSTERTNCGYVIIVLPHYGPESTLANFDIVELVLNQTRLIAKLIEKNALLYELQMKHHAIYSQSEAAFN